MILLALNLILTATKVVEGIHKHHQAHVILCKYQVDIPGMSTGLVEISHSGVALVCQAGDQFELTCYVKFRKKGIKETDVHTRNVCWANSVDC